MKDEQIKQIVDAILSQTMIDDWYFYFLIFSVSLVGTYFGALLRSFGKEKGKYKAIESSLDAIKKQVSETTKTAEKIKQDIELNVWREKDREMLKREKLEEYFSLILISRDAFHSEMENKLLKQNNEFDKQAYNKADLIQALYLPELSEAHNQYRLATVEYQNWLTSGMTEIQSQMKEGVSFATVSPEHMNSYGEIMLKFNPAMHAIKEKAKEVANEINT